METSDAQLPQNRLVTGRRIREENGLKWSLKLLILVMLSIVPYLLLSTLSLHKRVTDV